VIGVQKVGIWDVFFHHWKKYLLKNGFALGALSINIYLFMWLNSMNTLRFFPHYDSHLAKDLGELQLGN
jgi:hypothetical protein